jgi:histidyl-tRNA synthetase
MKIMLFLLGAEEMRKRTWLFDKFREVARVFSFQEYDAPVLEYEELYTRFVPSRRAPESDCRLALTAFLASTAQQEGWRGDHTADVQLRRQGRPEGVAPPRDDPVSGQARHPEGSCPLLFFLGRLSQECTPAHVLVVFASSPPPNLQGKALMVPVKWFSIPQCWRFETVTRGRRREHYQWNMDIIGVKEVHQ